MGSDASLIQVADRVFKCDDMGEPSRNQDRALLGFLSQEGQSHFRCINVVCNRQIYGFTCTSSVVCFSCPQAA